MPPPVEPPCAARPLLTGLYAQPRCNTQFTGLLGICNARRPGLPFPEAKRQRALDMDRKSASRSLPVRNLMRIELAMPGEGVQKLP